MFQTGEFLQIGQSSCRINQFLASGGFAQVYTVYINGSDQLAVLKCILATDSQLYNSCQNEIALLKRFSIHPHIVQYFDHSSTFTDKGHLVFILMEYCPGGHLVDYLNKRLQNRLSESEVLHIFNQVCSAVSAIHAGGVVHRDLKVENVLLVPMLRDSFMCKLCDFGSATTLIIKPGASISISDIRSLESEVQKFTTKEYRYKVNGLTYRAPELCDLYQGVKVGITTKTDIWALGCFLYKLCYFACLELMQATPFEESGQLAILNGKFTIPAYPTYSRNLINLISVMLDINPSKRPAIESILQISSAIEMVYAVFYQKNHPNPFAVMETLLSPTSQRINSSLRTSRDTIAQHSMVGHTVILPEPQIHLDPPEPMRRGRPPAKNIELTSFGSNSSIMPTVNTRSAPPVDTFKSGRPGSRGSIDPFADANQLIQDPFADNMDNSNLPPPLKPAKKFY